MPASTALYEPYRVVGLVSDNAPFVLQKLGDEVFLTAVVGNCFQVFKTERLVVCLVSKPAPGKITALQVRITYQRPKHCTNVSFAFRSVVMILSWLLPTKSINTAERI